MEETFAYHELDGVPCTAFKELLTNILRDEWGFDGIVVSDYFAVQEIERTHHLSSSKAESAHLALAAGIDFGAAPHRLLWRAAVNGRLHRPD